jgi:hypothetical protein
VKTEIYRLLAAEGFMQKANQPGDKQSHKSNFLEIICVIGHIDLADYIAPDHVYKRLSHLVDCLPHKYGRSR